ncbi:hypothetical protein M0813_24158 [Anaeramoeba flamelloides]|uniref:Uncharacterized protein n=1 Tax=Anaeramoeba flamelloides TaxID=1746091 RepID=A0ABQ8Y6K5_9EUKA|nr:hypothetical protein M0813_24158 [Anaeramoeba flamelloides]
MSNTILTEKSGIEEQHLQLVTSFQSETNCELGDALFILSLSNWNYEESIGVYTLTTMETLQRKRSLNALNNFEIEEKIACSKKRKTIKNKRYVIKKRVPKKSNNKPKSNANKNKDADSQNKNFQMISKNSLLTKKEGGVLSFENLKSFLTQDPAPGWRARIWAFKLYDENLVKGFPENLETKEPIILNKELFQIYVLITDKVSIKNLQRGIHAYLSKFGYHNDTNHNHKLMTFSVKK